MTPIVVTRPNNTPVVIARYSGASQGGGDISTALLKANNLSDLTNNVTARSNLGLGSLAVLSVVALANIASIADQTFLGNNTGSAASPIALTVAEAKTMLGLSGTNTGDQDLSGLLVKASNLSDLTNVVTARSNLGLGTAALSAATDFVAANVAITGATKTKITYDAKGLVTSGADATTADISDSLNKRYVTDAQLTVIGNTSGTNSGDQTITLTGDVTGSGTGSFAATIDTNKVTYAKFQQVAAVSLVGNPTGSLANASGITLGAGLQFSGTTLVNSITQYTDELAQDAVGAMVDASLVYLDGTPLLQRAALTGDVTASAGSNATTIANDAVTTAKILDSNVTLAKLVNASAASVLMGRGSAAGAGVFQEITLGSGLTMTGTVLSASGGGGTPGGADTQIQYNDGGAFGGSPSLTYDKVNDKYTFGTFAGSGNFVFVNSNGAASTGVYSLHSNATGTALRGENSSTGTAIRADSTTGNAFLAQTTGGKLFNGAVVSSDTNVATRVLGLFGHNSSGTVANNFGARLEFQLESSTTDDQTAAYIQWDWQNATHAGRVGRLRFYCMNSGSAGEVLRLDNNGGIAFPTIGNSVLLYQGATGVLSGASMNVNKVVTISNSTLPSTSSALSVDSSGARLGINNTSPGTRLHVIEESAVTNTVLDAVTIGRNVTAGAGANGAGAGLLFQVETTTTVNTDSARIASYLVDATHASRTSALTFATVNNAGSLTERFRVGGLASKFSGGIQLAKAAKTANYTALESDTAITSDATSGAVTITLPAATLTGHIIHVKRIDASANNTTVSRAGSDTIEGANSVTLAAQYESVTLIADGTATWYIIATT